MVFASTVLHMVGFMPATGHAVPEFTSARSLVQWFVLYPCEELLHKQQPRKASSPADDASEATDAAATAQVTVGDTSHQLQKKAGGHSSVTSSSSPV
jgi:hypothetical protein